MRTILGGLMVVAVVFLLMVVVPIYQAFFFAKVLGLTTSQVYGPLLVANCVIAMSTRKFTKDSEKKETDWSKLFGYLVAPLVLFGIFTLSGLMFGI